MASYGFVDFAPTPAVPASNPSSLCIMSEMDAYTSSLYRNCKPTLLPATTFDPLKDAERLRKAMKGLGTDEATIIEILGSRTSGQRQLIVKAFKSSFGRDLINDLKSELSGMFLKTVLLMMLPRYEMLAYCLLKAIEGLGTKESIIIDVLCTCTNHEIAKIREAYIEILKRKNIHSPSRTLEKDVIGDTSGDFKHLLVALLQGCRQEPTVDALVKARDSQDLRHIVDYSQAEQDANALYTAGEKKLGTDEDTFTRIMAIRSYEHISVVSTFYSKLSNHSLHKAISSETSGYYEKALSTILLASTDRSTYFSNRLTDSMKGMGTDDQLLYFLLVWRSEIDLFDIKETFQRIHRKSLESWIDGDTSGDYRKLILRLAGSSHKK